MKDKRMSFLLVVLSFALVVSLGLICFIGYNYFSQPKEVAAGTTTATQLRSGSTRDSLQQAYAKTISNIDVPIDSAWNLPDSLQQNLSKKLTEFNNLKAEITAILKNGSTANELGEARKKIDELQGRVDELRNRSLQIENENKRLAAALRQVNGKRFSADSGQLVQTTNLAKAYPSTQTIYPSKKNIANRPEAASIAISNLYVAAVETTDDAEKETASAERAEKLTGSFTIKNNTDAGTEILVVVTQPNGRVLQNAWDGGTFTSASGKKIYSCKIPVKAKKGEEKRLAFSLNADAFEKGDYNVQVYHNGVLVGRNKKTLL